MSGFTELNLYNFQLTSRPVIHRYRVEALNDRATEFRLNTKSGTKRVAGGILTVLHQFIGGCSTKRFGALNRNGRKLCGLSPVLGIT